MPNSPRVNHRAAPTLGVSPRGSPRIAPGGAAHRAAAPAKSLYDGASSPRLSPREDISSPRLPHEGCAQAAASSAAPTAHKGARHSALAVTSEDGRVRGAASSSSSFAARLRLAEAAAATATGTAAATTTAAAATVVVATGPLHQPRPANEATISNQATISPWETTEPEAEAAKAKKVSKGGLAARLGLAAGVGKGLRLADLAKPALKSKAAAAKLMNKPPLDVALIEAKHSRVDAKRAIAEGEQNLNKMYARDHDGMVTARALLVGANRAVARLMLSMEELEVQASDARDKLVRDASALRVASSASIEGLTAEREMLSHLLLGEIHLIETDTTFSLSKLMSTVRQAAEDMAALDHRLSTELAHVKKQLDESRQAHARTTESAEKNEARLSAEIARLCGVVEGLKADGERAAAEHASMHAQVVRTMSTHLADKTRTINQRDENIAHLKTELDGTNKHLNGKLQTLAREKAEREARLEEEKQKAIEEGQRETQSREQRLAKLQAHNIT